MAFGAAPARLRLVAAADVGLAVAAAVGRALALVELGGGLSAHLVAVVLDLAGVGFLLVAWVLLVGHEVSLQSMNGGESAGRSPHPAQVHCGHAAPPALWDGAAFARRDEIKPQASRLFFN